jgi:hypothetical protein
MEDGIGKVAANEKEAAEAASFFSAEKTTD